MTMKSLFFPCCLILALIFNSCSDHQEKVHIDPAFGQFVSAYSSGVISVTEPISIRLTQDYPKGNVLPKDLIEFEPEIEGVLELTDSRLLTFYPTEKLKGGTVYTAELDLPELFPEAGNLGEFTFQFETIQQNLSIYFDGYKMDDPSDISQVEVSGIIRTADISSLEELKSSVKAVQEGEELLLQLNELTNREFSFDILGAKRIEEKSSVTIEVDEEIFTSSSIENQKLEIPSISDFNVMSLKFLNVNENYIEILFSDPLQKQDLTGLITLEGIADEDLKIKQSKNKVELLLTGRQQGEKLVKVYADIKNFAGRKMGESFTKTLVFDPEDPAVRMVSKKFVLPSQSEGLLFPFEAVSLNSVDIFITKVFSNNVLQYLQNNNQGDGNSLYYVGRTVYKKHLDLKKVGSGKIHEWHRYQVDLSDVINLDRAALYQVELRFKREYAALDCIEVESLESSSFQNGWMKDDGAVEQDYWAGYSYNWQERDNPCSPSYYYRYRSKSSRVVMATNLGVIAKAGGDNLLHVVTTDLQTANPVSGASIEIYDYQQQLIGEGKSDAEGFATIECARAPLAVMVKTSDDQTLLKINDGNSLSLSKFDVEGRVIRDGLKGFIYTERGVWRTGDSIFVDFILRDESEKLPKGHPVKLEFYNSRGQLIDTKISANSLNGFHQFTLSTAQEDPTGDYRAEISVGNQKFSQRIPIETIKPNRLKIDLELNEMASTTESLRTELSAKWLNGVIPSGLSADIHMRLSSTRTSFDKFRGYHFDNLLESRISKGTEKVFEGMLEDDGTKSVSISLEDRGNNAPGMLRAYFETKVYEPGGGFSVDYYNTLISPYKSYVGMKVPEGNLWGNALEVDKTHSIQLAGINEDGQVPESREVDVSIFKIDRRWWFDRYSGDEYNYLNTSSYRKTKNETITLEKGKGSIDINIPKESWGRYLIRVEDLESGHTSAQFVFFDWPYWMRSNRTDGEAATILGISSDKEKYAPDETIKLTFPSPDNGRALITVENGTSILYQEWVKTNEGETSWNIPVTGEMAPNVYVHVSQIQPHSQTVNDRPIRTFGIIPIEIEDPNTVLAPTISLPEVLRPEESFTVKVSEESGKPMTYTLAVVDEGLLDITNFQTPQPHKYFYANEALGVRTWDYYDHIVSAYSLNSQDILSIGGDEEAADPSEQKARRFKPVVHHIGPFELKANGAAEHVLEMPNYVGAVRVMAVAGNEEAFGKAEQSVPVRSELMVLGSLPRVLGPGETASLPVNVFAMEEGVKEVTVELKTNSLAQATSGTTRKIQFEKPGEKMAFFEIKTPIEEGVIKISIEAKSKGKVASYQAEIQLETPNPKYTIVSDTVIEPGGSWSKAIEYFGVAGTNSAALEVSKLPSINLEKRLGYLMGYPHGCIEQTTSKAFPQLFLENFIELSANQKSEIGENVGIALRKITKFQNDDGGLGYWPSSGVSNEWGTNYAGHFFLVAEEMGYALPQGLKRNWVKFQKSAARSWQSQSSTVKSYSQRYQAYRLFTLALAREPEFGAMNQLREKSYLDNSAKWILSLAYYEAGRKTEAEHLIQTLPYEVEEYTELGYSYGSSTRDESIALLALNKIGKKTTATEVALRIAQKLNSKSFYSTQTTAFALMGLADYLRDYEDNGLIFDLSQNENKESIETGAPLSVKSYDESQNGDDLKLINRSKQPIYLSFATSGKPPEGKEVKKNANLRMEVNYLDSNFEPIDHKKLKKGTDLIAEIVITNPRSRTLEEMALINAVPSGWEILNSRLAGDSEPANGAIEYEDIRDAKIMTYFDMQPNQTLRFYARLNSSYSGRYYLPAILCNAMYDESIISIHPGEWIEVID